MEDNRPKKSFKTSFLCVAVIPLLVAGIIISVVSYSRQKNNIYNEIRTEMEYLAFTIANSYDAMYPGYYEIVKSDSIIALKKGDSYITSDFIDNIKEDTGLEITIFYEDVRMLTTIYDEDGNRILGTKMNSAIKQDVIDTDLIKFYDNVIIGKEKYFAYYMPLHNGDSDVIGAICVLKHAREVNVIISRSVLPLMLIIVVCIAAAVFAVIKYFSGISNSFNHIGNFLHDVESGKLNAEMSQDVLAREDEIGSMARSSVEMQKSIRNLVQKDSLTKLYNRSYCNERIRIIDKKSQDSGIPYTICISDIDFFKKVNDTYGHAAGDMVLVAVANTLSRFMRESGFAARWGGEEFLLVFERKNMEETEIALNNLLNEIRTLSVSYGEHIINVTMSVGVANAYGIEYEQAIKTADDRLYYAKTHGRDRVVARTE